MRPTSGHEPTAVLPGSFQPYARAILDTVREPMLVLDEACRVVWANRRFFQTFQVAPDETVGALLQELGNGQWDIPELIRLVADLPAGDGHFDDFEVIHDFPGIGTRVMLLNARQIQLEDGSAQLTLLALEDVSERRLAERVVREREAWLDLTLRSMGDAVVVVGTAGDVTFMNREAERFTGMTMRDALGRDVADVIVLKRADTGNRIESPLRRALRDGAVSGLANDTLLVTRNGREVRVAGSGAPIRSATGTLHGAVMIFHDVTVHHRAQMALQQAKEAAEAANRTKSEFLASMSHELRTPLSVIVGYTDLLIENVSGPLADSEREILGRVRRQAAELLDLITAMLDLSRLEAGRLPLNPTDVRIEVLFDEIRQDLVWVVERSGTSCTWRAEPSLPLVFTDAGRLKVVIKNLVGNALKFTTQGGVAVDARARGTGVEIRVTDTGIGIPPQALALIFEPFRQVETTSGSAAAGTGLGLHIVKRLLSLLGGTIEVESVVGRGTTFRLWLPTRPDA